MQQKTAGTANPRMRRSLLHDPSNLPAFKPQHRTQPNAKTNGAEPGEERNAVERKGNAPSSLARRLYSAATAPLAARPAPDPEEEILARSPEHVVGKGLKVLGHIVADGNVAVLGEVQGNVYCKLLLLGPAARIVGDVMAEDVVVHGRIVGTVQAERLTLKSACYVVGEIHHRAIKIEQGACFEGKSRRAERPISIDAISASLAEPQDPDVEFASCDDGEQTPLLAA